MSSYQFHCALVPREPPFTVRITLLFSQINVSVLVTLVGSVEDVANKTSTFTQVVVLQYPVALAK